MYFRISQSLPDLGLIPNSWIPGGTGYYIRFNLFSYLFFLRIGWADMDTFLLLIHEPGDCRPKKGLRMLSNRCRGSQAWRKQANLVNLGTETKSLSQAHGILMCVLRHTLIAGFFKLHFAQHFKKCFYIYHKIINGKTCYVFIARSENCNWDERFLASDYFPELSKMFFFFF